MVTLTDSAPPLRSAVSPSEGLQYRNHMVEKYLPLVRAIAADVCAGTTANVEYDDLVSAGVFGLIESVGGFDKDRGVKFSTYCKRRIRGSMLDELRQLDWVPRWTRQKSNQFKRARCILQARLDREPTEHELANELGVNVEELLRIQEEADIVNMVSLEQVNLVDSSEDVVQQVLPDARSLDPIAELQKKDAKAYITRSLTKQEKLILTLYYYEQLTMQEIGRILDISESRVSQIHSDVLGRLRERLGQTRQVLAETI